jgi:hypothetical protein
MSYPISPWIDSVERISPDGRFRALITQATEIAMGGPTRGVLVIAENQRDGRVHARLESCSPSFIWSNDSRALAVPQWTPSRKQLMAIVSVPSGRVALVAGEFHVLELHAFERGVVRGIDSPVYMPRNIQFPVEGLIENESARD